VILAYSLREIQARESLLFLRPKAPTGTSRNAPLLLDFHPIFTSHAHRRHPIISTHTPSSFHSNSLHPPANPRPIRAPPSSFLASSRLPSRPSRLPLSSSSPTCLHQHKPLPLGLNRRPPMPSQQQKRHNRLQPTDSRETTILARTRREELGRSLCMSTK
jgi:hypothetical protein